jgi:hypothetical protein
MFLLKNFKIILIICAAIFSASCGSCSTPQNTNINSFIAEEIKTGIPFSTKEPDVFQTDIIVTANGAERKYSLARNGKNRLIIFNRGAKNETSLLQTEDGKSFIINAANKTYTENISGGNSISNDLNQYLTTEWLNQRTEAAFTNLGTENGLTKYQVKLAESDNSEIVIYFDENLQMPVKQEFYAVSNGQKTLTFTVEMKNFKTQTDENLFAIPNDFKKNE